ncbi:hypothetical protein N752_21465 [Desulforamulus aquiferis]|nr:hypothetical protein N752_21465 [Desulforamulus aquiferis]
MAERIIGKIGDQALRKVCKPVTEINSNILSLLDDMTETLDAESNGAALAAPQVGILRRMVVINTGQGFIELINPTIIDKSGEQIARRLVYPCPAFGAK